MSPACAASFIAIKISGKANPVMKPAVPCSMSKPAYNAPRPVKMVQPFGEAGGVALPQSDRSAAMRAGVGSASSLMHSTEGTSCAMRATSFGDMCTWVEAGWSWQTMGSPGQPSATRVYSSTSVLSVAGDGSFVGVTITAAAPSS